VPSLPPEVLSKVEAFTRGLATYMHESYKEAETRLEFIDPLLVALGWDVSNTAGAADRFKEVVVEPTQSIEGRKRSPDYVLRVGGTPVLFVEAKKPSVRIGSDGASAFQARSYGWSAKLPIVLLTNFAEFAIYNTTVRPKPTDGVRVARIFHSTYDQLPEVWADLAAMLSKEAVIRGELDALVGRLPARGGREPIDKAFLADLDQMRLDLAWTLHYQNPKITDAQLVTAVQSTLDRLLFLRICEDRSVEPYGSLLAVAKVKDPLKALHQTYAAADARYNSGLFHFEVEPGRGKPDELTPTLKMRPESLTAIIEGLYPPRSPYAFAVMPSDVLGQAYENFLGKQLVRRRGAVTIEVKPEVRKAGGVFYTPPWLCNEVVSRTLKPILGATTPDQLRRSKTKRIRIVDPSCGSGTFLVAVYRQLLDWYLVYYLADVTRWSKTRPPRIERNAAGDLALSLDERKRILTDHIYGVDLDAQAVEVAKLNLLLVVLEDQTAAGLQDQLSVFKARVLPDLDANIKCGNSLVNYDFYADDDLEAVETNPMKAFDWRTLVGGQYEAVVGNPPWLMAGYNPSREYVDYLARTYAAYTGKADLYYLFLERSLQLVSPSGRVGMVVPSKMYTTRAAKGLRRLLTQPLVVEGMIDFGVEKIFERATNYTQAIFLDQSRPSDGDVAFARATAQFRSVSQWVLETSRLTEARWDTNSPEAQLIWEHMRSVGNRLEDVVTGFGNGVQSGADPLLVLAEDEVRSLGLERDVARPFLRGRDIRGGDVVPAQKYLVFPYKESRGDFAIFDDADLANRPALKSYLDKHRAKLETRRWFGQSATQLTGHWWGLMYVDDAARFAAPHLLTPSLADRSHFALGDGSLFATGTAGVTSVILKRREDASWLLALLNSRLISEYIVAHSTPYQGGYFKFSAPYLRHVPIVTPANKSAKETLARLGRLWEQRRAASGAARVVIDRRIDGLVFDLYGVAEAAIDAAVGPRAADDSGDEEELA
jgi:tRNA1(Val) A37 N6-methylase TrmN6